MHLSLIQAEPDDAETIAHLVRVTSGGVVDYLLGGLSRLVSTENLLTSVIMETGHPLSHENVVLLRDGETVAGLLLAYPGRDHLVPDILAKVVSAKKLRLLHGLLNEADPQSLYINTLWVHPEARGTGVADTLIECAGLLAGERGLPRLSLHVWLDNARAVRFYQRQGFALARHFEVEPQKKLDHEGGYDLLWRTAQDTAGATA